MSSLMKPDTEQSTASPERERARRRLERKRKFYGDVAAYVLINAFLVVVWAFTGFGYFWPGWIAGFWGVLLALDAWALYYRKPITEDDIDRELQRGR